MDFVRDWSDKTELLAVRLVDWIGITTSKHFDWHRRYGKVNEHNAWIPRDHWLENWKGKRLSIFSWIIRMTATDESLT